MDTKSTGSMDAQELERRVSRACELFESGFNCSQSVVGAFADLYGFSQEQALKMAASFGGGIGRMRQTCGAACGMFLLAGLECGCTDPSDREGKSYNYKVVQELAAEFEKRNGSLICSQLLGVQGKETKTRAPYQAQARTPEYYKKRPCREIVKEGARIFGEFLLRGR